MRRCFWHQFTAIDAPDDQGNMQAVSFAGYKLIKPWLSWNFQRWHQNDGIIKQLFSLRNFRAHFVYWLGMLRDAHLSMNMIPSRSSLEFELQTIWFKIIWVFHRNPFVGKDLWTSKAIVPTLYHFKHASDIAVRSFKSWRPDLPGENERFSLQSPKLNYKLMRIIGWSIASIKRRCVRAYRFQPVSSSIFSYYKLHGNLPWKHRYPIAKNRTQIPSLNRSSAPSN